MAFPTARPPGGSPTLSVLKTRVCGRFALFGWTPRGTSYPRPAAGTLGGLLPQGEVLPFGALLPLLPIGYRHAVGLETWVSVSYLGLYTWAIQPTPIEASIMLEWFSCAGFWVVVLLELLQVFSGPPSTCSP